MVVDGEDHIAGHYRKQKLQVEKYFTQRRLDRMQQKLVSLANGPDKQELQNHIKEKTGNDLEMPDTLIRESKNTRTEITSRGMNDGIEEVRAVSSTGTKPKHFRETELLSPDGKRTIRIVEWGDGKESSTQISLQFPTVTTGVYAVKGIVPDIKASWKNNATIVIETKPGYEVWSQHKEIRNFDDIVKIEYLVGV